MSDSNNRNNGFDDYFDLLNQYAPVDQLEDEYSTQVEEETGNIEDSEYSEYVNSSEELSDLDEYVYDLDEYYEYDVPKNPQTPQKRVISAPPMVENIGEKEKNPFKRLAKWFKDLPPKKKVLVSILAVILAIVLVLVTILGVFVVQKLSLLGDGNNGEYDDVIYEDGEFEDIEIDIGSAGFKQALIDWATKGNDKKMSSKNVINVLLIGADSRNGTNSGNTDVMMLISVNKKTKQLKMVSFFRDSYLYVEGKNRSYCTKLNAAFSMGGPQTLIQTIENNYKIEIDNYVMVNFESFTAIIDAMGGVQVDVQQYEADYNYKKFKVELPVGEGVTLNGKQALCFVRIRGCDADGDVSRTRRQRQVIDSMVSRVKEASVSDLNKYIDILLPYVETGYSEGQILSLGIKAITGGWANYERKQLQMPPEDCRTSGSANMWIWVVDYQLAAHKLQMELYGDSNITIKEDRISIIDVYNGANYTGSSDTIGDNNNSGEAEVPDVTVPVITTENNNIVVTDPNNNYEPTPDVSETQNNDVTENNQGEIPDETQQSGGSGDSGSSGDSGNQGDSGNPGGSGDSGNPGGSGDSGNSGGSGDSGNSGGSGDSGSSGGSSGGEAPAGGEGDA